MPTGPLGQITDQTTMGELALLRAQYGVTRIHTAFVLDADGTQRCWVTLVTEQHTAIGTSAGKGKSTPLIEAMSDAFARLIHVIGAAITVEGAENGASAKWAL